MATSGTVDYTLTAIGIIDAALEGLNIIGIGRTPSAEDREFARRSLNLMISAMQNEGIGLWLVQHGTLYLTASQQSYLLGPTGDNCISDEQRTTLADAGTALDATIELTDKRGFSNGGSIAILLDDDTLQWTTLSAAITDTATPYTATLTDALSGAAASGNYVYRKTNRPLEILEARYVDSSGTETPINRISNGSYQHFPVKSSTGQIVQLSYLPNLTNGTLYVWPTSANSTDTIKFTYKTDVEDLVNNSDNVQFPKNWLNALVWNLMMEIADNPAYGIPVSDAARMKAYDYKEKAMRFDSEPVPILLGLEEE